MCSITQSYIECHPWPRHTKLYRVSPYTELYKTQLKKITSKNLQSITMCRITYIYTECHPWQYHTKLYTVSSNIVSNTALTSITLNSITPMQCAVSHTAVQFCTVSSTGSRGLVWRLCICVSTTTGSEIQIQTLGRVQAHIIKEGQHSYAGHL